MGDIFVMSIVSCDESWVHHSTPETKISNMGWCAKDERTPVMTKTRLLARFSRLIFVILKVLCASISYFNEEQWMLRTTLKSWVKIKRPVNLKCTRIRFAASCLFMLTLGPTLLQLQKQNRKIPLDGSRSSPLVHIYHLNLFQTPGKNVGRKTFFGCKEEQDFVCTWLRNAQEISCLLYTSRCV